MEPSSQDRSRLAEQYDRLASKFNELYVIGRDRGRVAMGHALDKAQDQLATLGEFSAEQGRELRAYLERDLDQTIADMQRLGQEARERLHPARLGAGALSSLATVLEVSSEALQTLSDKAAKSLTYKTGEVTSAGTLTCQACGQAVHLRGTGHVPPCPKCGGTAFRKGY